MKINGKEVGVFSEFSGGGTGGADYSFLNGKKYYALGDSIAAMQGTTAAPKTFGDSGYTTDLQSRAIGDIVCTGYIQAIESRYGLVASNFAAGGATLVAHYSMLVGKDYSDVALVTIAYGVNDARTGVPLGDVNSTDVTTFAGALNQLLRKIYTDNPECRVLVLSPMQRLTVTEFGIATPNANGNYLIDFVDMCHKVAEKRSTICIDQYRDSGINQTNLYYYTVEGVHPVNQGFARIRNLVIAETDKLFALEFEPFGEMTNAGDTEPEQPDTGDSGGTDTPEEDTGATVIDLSTLSTRYGIDMDGWGTGIKTDASQSGCICVDYHPEANKTYTVVQYINVATTDYRFWSWRKLNDDGSVATGNYILFASAERNPATTIETVEIDGTTYQKLTTVRTTEDVDDNYYWCISFLSALRDRCSISYV